MNFFKKLQMMFKRTGTDKTIYACTIFLACFGIVMIGDASVGMSASRGSNFATINLLKREFDSCLQFFTNQIAQNVDYINAFEFFYCQIR